MIWMMEDGRWWKCCSLQVAPSLSQLGNKTVATSSSSDSAARIAFDVSGPQQQQRRWCREKVRWTILFFAATQIVAGALGEKGKAAKSKLATSPLLASADPLTSADFCEGEMLWGQILYSQCHQNTQLPMYLKNNCVCLCFIFWQPSPRTFPWCLIGRRGRSESIARVRLNYQPQELTGPRYPILSNSSPHRTTFAQK